MALPPRTLHGDDASGVDIHQLNCTYYSALETDDDRYLAARAIQHLPGVSHRSTTWGCWPARTTSPRSIGPVRAAQSIDTTIHSKKWHTLLTARS